MSLLTLLSENTFPESLRDSKILLFPKKYPGAEVTHSHQRERCASLEFRGSFGENNFYNKIMNNVNAESYVLLSVNEFLENASEYCEYCCDVTPVTTGFDSDSIRAYTFFDTFTKIDTFLKALKENKNVSSWVSLKWSIVSELETITNVLNNVKEFETFKSSFMSILKDNEVFSGNSLKSLRDFVSVEMSVELISFPKEMIDSKSSSLLSVSREALKNELVESKDFVIFENDYGIFNSLRLSEKEKELMLQLYLFEGFKVGPFSVLPYPEFLAYRTIWLKYGFEMYSPYFTVVSSSPSFELLEVMEGLFDDCNTSLGTYSDVYNISVNI